MVTAELLDFLRAQLAAGMSPLELERVLVEEGGWDKVDVEEGLTRMGIPRTVPAPVTPPTVQHIESMQIASSAITAPPEQTVIEEPKRHHQPEPRPRTEEASPVAAPVVLNVRSERKPAPPVAADDDFLGIFTSAPAAATSAPEAVITALPVVAAKAEVPKEEMTVRVDRPQQPTREVAVPEAAAPTTTPNLMDMLAPVSAPIENGPPAAEAVAAKPSAIKFDLSRIKQERPEPSEPAAPVIAAPVIGVAPLVAVPEPITPVVASKPVDKAIETRSVAELWLTQGKVEAQPAQNETKEKELRASLSMRRTMTSDILLRGKGAAIQGLPALLPAEESNPMPEYSSRKVTEEKKVAEEKRVLSERPKPTVAEQLARKNKIKKTLMYAGSAIGVLALVAGAAVAFLSMRGPDVSTLLASTMTNFYATPSFTYSGNASSSLVLTSKSGGESRGGAVKFAAGYAGELKNDKYGFGNGNHLLKWSGGLSSGNFTWGTDIESGLRMLGTDLFFHVLSFPPQSDIDPDLFKSYWIKVDIAEIAKELALDAVTSDNDYNGLAGTESTTFNAIVAKDLPFMGGTKIGSESVNNIPTTHFVLTTEPEKMYTLAGDLYKKYMGKTFTFNADGKIRLLNALEKLKVEIWVDEKTSTLVKVNISGDIDDDIDTIHVKGPVALSFVFSNYGAAVTVTEPAPYLSLDELHARMNDFKKFNEVRARDAAYINGLGEVEHALAEYMGAKGRFPTTLVELRANGILATSTLSDALLKTYVYAPYVKAGDFTKANKCLPKSKTCTTYHIGVNLEDMNDPALRNDADQTSDVHGTDTSGCSIEREKACYDIVFNLPSAASPTIGAPN